MESFNLAFFILNIHVLAFLGAYNISLVSEDSWQTASMSFLCLTHDLAATPVA